MGEATLRAPGLCQPAARRKKALAVLLILGQSARTGEVLSGGLKFENSWEQEIRSHCRQRVRTGVEEASANVSGAKLSRT